MLAIILSYIYFVKVAGPSYMKTRKPFQIEGVIVAYNLLMVVLSSYFFFYGGTFTYLSPKFSWICEPIDYSLEPDSLELIRLGWWYLILKISEFADTIFFVLRKKNSHITVLHVVHHSLVAWGVWVGMKFGAGGHNAFFPFINCFVHMIMYFYYCLTALGPRMRPYLWWKKYLTIVQMVQFVVAFVHAMLPLYFDCGFHPGFAYGLMAHAVLFWVMFYNFYNKAYNSDKNQKVMTNGDSTDHSITNGHSQNGSAKANGVSNKNGYTKTVVNGYSKVNGKHD